MTAAYEAFRNMDFCSYSAQNLVFFPQKYNADFDLSAKEGADSLAFISLIEEKLRPALVRLRVLSPLFPLNAGFEPSVLPAL